MTIYRMLKCYSVRVLVVIASLFLPLGVLAQYNTTVTNKVISVRHFGNGNTYAMTATFDGYASNNYSIIETPPTLTKPGKLQFTGVDPNAEVTFSVKANVGNPKDGVYVISRDSNGKVIKPYEEKATFKVSELQDISVEGRGLERKVGDNIVREGAESGQIKAETDATGANNNLPFVNQADPAPKKYGGSENSPSSPSQSDKASQGGGSDKKALVPCDGTDCTLDKLLVMGARIYNYLAGMGAVAAVAAIVYAGFSYIKSAGDPAEMKAAKQKIVYAIIGLVILGASVVIVNTVLTWTGSSLRVENISAK